MSGPHQDIDRETFLRFQRGDEAASFSIVEAYYRRLIGFLTVQTGSREHAEDLAQEVFVTAFEKRATLRGEGQLKSWLFTVAARLASRERSRGRRQVQLDSDEFQIRLESLSEAPEQAEGMLKGEVRLHLERAIQTLPPEEQELVMLRFFGDMQIKELSDALSMPMGTVGVKLGRALAKVRKYLERDGHSLESML